MSFSASYDRTTKIVSTVVCLGLLAVILGGPQPDPDVPVDFRYGVVLRLLPARL